MSLVDEYIREQRERRRSTIIKTIVVFLGIIAVFAYSIYDDKHRQQELYTHGGAVGVENKTDHAVDLHLFVNDAKGTVLTHHIAPQGYWVLRDSMSKAAVSNFPRMEWLCLSFCTMPTLFGRYPTRTIVYTISRSGNTRV